MNKKEILDQIEKMCQRLNNTQGNSSMENYCPVHLDHFQFCWPPTPPNTTISMGCPNNISYAYATCQSNGTWIFNRTNCTKLEGMDHYNFINKLYVMGYSVSLVALIVSLIIFFVFRFQIDRTECAHPSVEHKRSLRCTRIRLHIHLFISFVLNNIIWIAWYTQVVWNVEASFENPEWCQLMYLGTQYFMITNYMWMFCEALYLHLSLVVVFVRDEVAMRYFIAIGWAQPILITATYACIRIYVDQNTDRCWMDPDDNWSQWILSVPVGLSLLASLIFLINVLRVILNVMHPRSSDPAMAGIKRAARAASILIPLFGLHYLLLPCRPTTQPYMYIYDYISVALVAPQGFCVSCLFCFANHDVHQAIKAFIHRQLHTSRWSNYYYTGAPDSAGVYVINSYSQSNNFALI